MDLITILLICAAETCFIFAALLLGLLYWLPSYYRCRTCGEQFKPSRFQRVTALLNAYGPGECECSVCKKRYNVLES